MTIRDRKALKQTAGRRIGVAAYPPRKLILIHSGVMLGVSLLMTICNYIITWQIDANGGGLSGMQLRSILETASQFLALVYAVATPFWSMGIVYATLRLARGKAAWPGSLLEGFRRKGPVLRLMLLQTLIYGVIGIASIYGSWILYSITPDGQAFMEAITQLVYQGITDYAQLIEAIPTAVIERVARVYLPILGVVLLGLTVPAAYRLRLAPYVLMDKAGTGAWKAARMSGKLTQRNCFKLLWLDLSYWWYYLIPAVLMLPAFADQLLPVLGIQLPVDSAVLYIVGNLIYVVLTLIFEYFAKPKVMTTYALAYDVLLDAYNAAQPAKPEGSEG